MRLVDCQPAEQSKQEAWGNYQSVTWSLWRRDSRLSYCQRNQEQKPHRAERGLQKGRVNDPVFVAFLLRHDNPQFMLVDRPGMIGAVGRQS